MNAPLTPNDQIKLRTEQIRLENEKRRFPDVDFESMKVKKTKKGQRL